MKSPLLLLLLGLVLGMPALAGSQGDRGPPADVLAVRNVEVTFHTAGSVLPREEPGSYDEHLCRRCRTHRHLAR